MMIPNYPKNVYNTFLAAIVLASLISTGTCSAGDNLPEFKACVGSCIRRRCDKSSFGNKPELDLDDSFQVDEETSKLDGGSGSSSLLPLPLRLTFWTCPQNCDYLCQRTVTKKRIENGQSVEQFHGKWPFLRVFGVQEPFSVLFSILNFIPHYQGFKMLQQFLKVTSPGSGASGAGGASNSALLGQSSYSAPKILVYTYMGIAITGMNAWIWSSVFHVRDFISTERLDYFSAGLTVLYGFYACVVRVFGLYKSPNSSLSAGYSKIKASSEASKLKLLRSLLAVVCTIAYCSHIYFLQFVRFDYGYNMLANVVVGLLQNVMWVYLAISEYNRSAEFSNNVGRFLGEKEVGSGIKGRKESWRLLPLYLVISVTLAMSFELLDFPPLFDSLDAHALWHAGTVLPTYFWYIWMKNDLNSLKYRKTKL